MRPRAPGRRVRLPRLRNRWRITLWILLTVLVVTGITGTVAVQAVQRQFTSTIDDQLRNDASTAATAVELLDPDVLQRITDDGGVGQAAQAAFVLGPTGVELSLPSGPAEDPDPLPDLDGRTLASLRGRAGEPFEAASADGSISYRVLTVPLDDGRLAVVARPLTQRDDAIRALISVLLVAAVVATVVLTVTVASVAGYVTRPLEAMIDTATEIGSGDETRLPAEGVEDVARLAAALNAMLDRLASAYAAREASEETMRRFVANASHELRTPLAAILGYAELHQNGMIEAPEQLDRAMGRISAEGERMRLLIEELLLLARLDQQRELERVPVEVGQLVEVAVLDARAIDPHRPLTLARGQATGRAVLVRGDPTTLRQAIDNLLANARAHTPPDTPVVVTVSGGPTVTVAVADAGPGLGPADAARVFDRFYRAERSRARPGGSGLGLAIVAAIAEAHGGRVEVETAPGAGATFTLTLPVLDDPGRVLPRG